MAARTVVLLLSVSVLLCHHSLARASTARCQQCLAVFAGYGNDGRGADIYLLRPDGSLHRLTHDNLPKGLPVLSPNGSMVAFSFPEGQKHADGTIIVLDTQGNVLAKILVEPARPGVPSSGIREVDRIAWLDPTGRKIAVTGARNPTQTSTYVINLPPDLAVSAKRGPQLLTASSDDLTDDADSLTFSPDGKHVASVGGIPHFDLNEADKIVPSLYVDDVNFRVRNRPYVFASPLAWSADSQKLAFLTRDNVGPKRLEVHILDVSAVGAHRSSRLLSGDVSKLTGTANSGTWRLRWRGGDVFISPPSNDPLPGHESWKFAAGDPRALSHADEDLAFDSFFEARAQASDLFGDLIAGQSALAPDDVDVWCRDRQCGALSERPRQNPDRAGTMFDQTAG